MNDRRLDEDNIIIDDIVLDDGDIDIVFENVESEDEIEYEEIPIAHVTATHDTLMHRDYPDQHPIGSISQLTDELSGRPASVISDAEIMAL